MQLLRFIKDHADSEDMKDNPSRILEAMDEFAAQHEFLINIGPDKAKIISGLILENKPRVLVEFGGYVGYSAILFADQMRAHASENREVHVWSLEMDPDIATIARDLISTAGLSDYVTVVDGKAADSLRKLKEEGKVERIDFLFLDHDESLYEQDLKLALDELKLLQQNACIVADNVLRPGAPKYREYVQNHSGLRTRSLKALIIPGEFEVSRRLLFDFHVMKHGTDKVIRMRSRSAKSFDLSLIMHWGLQGVQEQIQTDRQAMEHRSSLSRT